MNCEDCDYTVIADWEPDKKTGKVKPVYWCERYEKLCSDISECQYKIESEKLNKKPIETLSKEDLESLIGENGDN